MHFSCRICRGSGTTCNTSSPCREYHCANVRTSYRNDNRDRSCRLNIFHQRNRLSSFGNICQCSTGHLQCNRQECRWMHLSGSICRGTGTTGYTSGSCCEYHRTNLRSSNWNHYRNDSCRPDIFDKWNRLPGLWHICECCTGHIQRNCQERRWMYFLSHSCNSTGTTGTAAPTRGHQRYLLPGRCRDRPPGYRHPD